MTAPVSSNSNEAPIFLDVPLLTSEDDNCTFISDTIPEGPEDIVDWFDKNDEQMVLNNDTMISNKPDPLLIQINARDSPTLLHLSDTDADGLGDICMGILDSPESDYFEQNSTPPDSAQVLSKTDKNMNSLSKDNNPNMFLSRKQNKCDILEDIFKSGLTVEACNSNNKLHVRLRNEFGNDIFPIHFIAPNEIGHVTLALVKQSVVKMEKMVISSELETRMPCLHTKLGLRVWLCPHLDCRRAFYRHSCAKLHALKHLDHKPFKCEFSNCEWAFYTSFKLRRHEETHSKRKDFVCSHPDCDRRFTTVYNLNWHRRHYHEKPATLPCLVKGCDKYFQTMRARELHLKAHGKAEAPYRCPVTECNKPFFLFTALSTHARAHSHKLSDLRCQYPNCGRVFEQPCRLKQHTLQHTGQRPFTCTYEECKWAFSTASKLKRHLSTHTNERKFHCTMGSCNKSFLRSEHLRDHTLTHIGQRPFHCDECDASFTGKSGLCLHMKKSHPKLNKACARAVPYQQQSPEKLSSDDLLEQAIQSLDVPSDMMLGTGLLPEEPLELLENEHFSTVNLRDLD